MKRLSRSLAAALMLALLAGCGQAQPGTDVNGSSSSVGQPNQSLSDGSTGGQTVPVLMGGALPFTGMESVTAENYLLLSGCDPGRADGCLQRLPTQPHHRRGG